MPAMLFAFVVVLLGACIHHDPAVGAFIIMGFMLGLMGLIALPMWIYCKINEPKWKAREEAEFKKKYPNARPLSELLKELGIKDENNG